MPRVRDPFIVSDETCRGCIYYRYLSGAGLRACHYTLDTGKFRPLDMPCDECTYKVTTRRRVNRHSSNGGKNSKKAGGKKK